MDLRQAVRLFGGSHDGLLHNVTHASRLRGFNSVQLELCLIQRIRPEEEQSVAPLKRREKSFGAVIVDDGRFDPSGSRGFRPFL
jgi:hypothetical protein